MKSASILDPDWEHYFFSQFEGPEKLKTKLIRCLAARICSSNSALKRKIERRGNTPHYMIIRDLKVHSIIEDLKHVAKDNKEVRERIVNLVRNRESVLGEERRENPAVKETPVFEDDEDGRTPMILRARTFGKIVAEIGTARSRRVERVMKRAEERRQLASSSGDADEDCGTGLEVMVTVSGKSFWVADTMATGMDDLRTVTRSVGEGDDQKISLRGCNIETRVSIAANRPGCPEIPSHIERNHFHPLGAGSAGRSGHKVEPRVSTTPRKGGEA